MKTRGERFVTLVWALATFAAGWLIGNLQVAVWLAAASGAVLYLFVLLWRATTLGGALLTFAVPTAMVVAGGLLFGSGYRAAGYAVLIGSGLVFPALGYWAFMHLGHGRTVAGLGATPEEIDALLGDGAWAREESKEPAPLPGYWGNGLWGFAEWWPMRPPGGGGSDGWRTRR